MSAVDALKRVHGVHKFSCQKFFKHRLPTQNVKMLCKFLVRWKLLNDKCSAAEYKQQVILIWLVIGFVL
jgi:hypothetical protein